MTVAQSYAYAEQVARTRAKNFYYSFLLLNREKRRAMCAVYAFMRYCDDLSDDVNLPDRRAAIAEWRAGLDHALAGGAGGDHAVWPALLDTVNRFRIPHEYLYDMIEGVSSDLEPRRIQTFDELYGYCYRVASVVGLTIVHIFGFESAEALKLAEKCGIAFQITNILRDVREDEGLDRVYLPAEDLRRFGVTRFEHNGAFRSLMQFEADRARRYYAESRPLIEMVSADSRGSLWALIEIYWRLLGRIERADYDVLSQRVRVPGWEKVWILARGLMKTYFS